MPDKNGNGKETKKNDFSEVEEDLKDKEQDLIEMGKFYFLNNKYDEAIGELKKAANLNPKNPDIYYNLGIIYETKNMQQEAREMFTKTLELNEKHQLAQEHLDKLIGT
ncbi:MAG: tetratricopeptide repeat protein [bacterium]